MGLIGYQEQLRTYRAEQAKQVIVAGGRLAVDYALRHQPGKISFLPTDAPDLLSVNTGQTRGMHDYAVRFRSLEDVFDLGPIAVLGLLPENTRQRTDFWWVRNLLALREPTLPILVDSAVDVTPYDSAYDVKTIERLRTSICISCIASAALYNEIGGVPVVGRVSNIGTASPAPVAA